MFFVVNDQKIALDQFISELKEERKRLDESISALERLPVLLPQVANRANGFSRKALADKQPVGGSSDLYTGVSAPKAAADCLRRAGKPLPTRDLIELMFAGGFTTRAKNFEANLYTVLAHRPEIFIKVSPGVWSLA